MCHSLTTQVRSIGSVTTAVARGDLSKMIEIEAEGEMAVLKNVSVAARLDRVTYRTDGQLDGAAINNIR